MNRSNIRFKLHEQYHGPHKDLSPEDVVKIMLHSLKSSETGPLTEGLSRCYRFISPVSRYFVGPVSYLREYTSQSVYQYLIGHQHFRLQRVERGTHSALITVQVHDMDFEEHIYLFLLTKQEDQHAGCWMLDLAEYQADREEGFRLN